MERDISAKSALQSTTLADVTYKTPNARHLLPINYIHQYWYHEKEGNLDMYLDLDLNRRLSEGRAGRGAH